MLINEAKYFIPTKKIPVLSLSFFSLSSYHHLEKMEQVQHSLSRLALARAIKTTDNESEEEAWNKSIIFNQPFVKDLHRQKHQLARQLEKTGPSQGSQYASSTRNFKRDHHQHKASSSSGSSLSLTLGNI